MKLIICALAILFTLNQVHSKKTVHINHAAKLIMQRKEVEESAGSFLEDMFEENILHKCEFACKDNCNF